MNRNGGQEEFPLTFKNGRGRIGEESMRVLISLTDQSFRSTKSLGILNVSLGLTRALAGRSDIDELHILGNAEYRSSFAECGPHVHLHEMERAVPSGWKRVLWDQWGVCRAIRRIAPDWALLPKGFPPFFLPGGRTRTACYVHDINWEYYQRLKAGESPFPPRELVYFRTLCLRALRAADLVLTSTRFNVERFQAWAPGVRAVPIGIGFPPAEKRERAQGNDILLYVSPFPHKLTRQAVKWLSRWLETPAARGRRIHAIGRLPADLKGTLSPERWIEHGRLAAGELKRISSRECGAALYFSAYEGFGMPPVECLLSGVPCLASDLPPIRENVPARYLFSNEKYGEFEAKLNAALSDRGLPETLPQPTWDEVAERCVRAMEACPPPKP